MILKLLNRLTADQKCPMLDAGEQHLVKTMLKVKNIPYAHQSIDEHDIKSVAEALNGDMITRGLKVEEFEQAIAEYCGVEYAVAFNSGTSAINAAYFAANLSELDRVITTPNSFVGTIGGAFQVGAKPVFVDIDRQTGNFDLDQVEININVPCTRGRTFVVPVHFAGIPVDMLRLERMIKDPDTVVIEDAAHAMGSKYADGKRVGCCEYSQMTVFSFHPIKTITTGEGGMVTTNDVDLYERLKLYRNNGIVRTSPWNYDVSAITGNFNITEFQAALGLSQLQRIEKFIKKRRKLVEAYREHLRACPEVKLLTSDFDSHVAFHLFVIQVKSRDEVMQKLNERGVGTQIHYKPIYHHSFYQSHDISEYFPEMEGYFEEALSLPLYYDLKNSEVEKISKILVEVIKSNVLASPK